MAASESCHLTSVTFTYPIGKKNPVKSDQFFSGDRDFYPTNNFTLLKLTQTKHFYLLLFLLNKNQIREILKKNYQIYYAIIWLSDVGWGSVVKKGKFTAADQSKLVSCTGSSSEEEEEDVHADVSFDELIHLAINNFFFLFLK